MLKQLLSTTALVLALSTSAWAQTADTDATMEQTTDQPAAAGDTAADTAQGAADTAEGAADDAATAAGDAASQAGDAMTDDTMTGTAETEPAMEEPADGATTGAATTDTGEAIIATEEEGQLKADDLMGLSVVSGEGETIGEVQDLIFDQDEKITGVVVSVGGFLGIGAKNVGLNWDQAEVQQNPDTGEEVILVNMTRQELEEAPEFMTQEEQQAEEDAAAASQQMEDTTAPAAPATGDAAQ